MNASVLARVPVLATVKITVVIVLVNNHNLSLFFNTN